MTRNASNVLDHLAEVIESRKSQSPDSSYVSSLFSKGLNKILEKVGEETTEVILAAKDYQGDGSSKHRQELIGEVTDLWFHTMVMMSDLNLGHNDVMAELERRFGTSGHDEKASRTPST